MANQDVPPILVEKHYIPRDVYLNLYRPLTNMSSSRTPAALPPTRVTPFSRMFNNFFPTTHEPSNTSGNTNAEDDNTGSTGYADLMSLFSNVAGGTGGLVTNATRRINTTTGHSGASGSYSVRTESRTGPDGTPIIVESAAASIPVNGSTGDAFNMLLSALLNTSIGSSSNESRLTQGQIANNSRVFTFNSTVDLDTTECPICTAEWINNEELRKLNMCRHYFHRACIDRWLEDHVNCPLCRVNVMPPDINEVD